MFLFWYEYRAKQEHSFSGYTLTQAELQQLQNGDILLRHGYGLASDIIVKTLNEKYDISHCAILCKDNNKFNVIHSVSQSLSDFDGVQTQLLSKFINDSKMNSLIVVRYKNPLHRNNDLIAERAKYYLAKKIPFDNDFDIEDSTHIYCNELIWRIIKDSYHRDIFKNQLRDADRKNHYKFNALWDTTLFTIVINHQLRKK
jgi:hypothetical protein